MAPFLQALVGAIVWTFANLLYVDLKRKGVRNFARIVAFWTGMPTTWLSLLLVREGEQPRFQRHPDDDASLLAQVRLDRARRLAEQRRSPARRSKGRALGGEVDAGRDAGGAEDVETT